MKKRLFLFIILAVFIVNITFIHINGYASNIYLVMDSEDLISIKSQEQKLFNIKGAQPGDQYFSWLSIENKGTETIELSMKAQNKETLQDATDLTKVVRLIISQGDKIIYDGKLSGSDSQNVPMGKIQGKSSVKLDFMLDFSGDEIGNEFRNITTDFLVYIYGENDKSSTGTDSNSSPVGANKPSSEKKAETEKESENGTIDITQPEQIPGGALVNDNIDRIPKTADEQPVIYMFSLLIAAISIFVICKGESKYRES